MESDQLKKKCRDVFVSATIYDKNGCLHKVKNNPLDKFIKELENLMNYKLK